jgi:hypothetical protein
MTFRLRLGAFFILMSLFLLLLFIGSVAGKGENKVLFLFTSAVSLFFGFLLSRRPKSDAPGARFSTLRRMGDSSRKRRAEREAKKQQKTSPHDQTRPPL